jgi:hypothetical protein
MRFDAHALGDRRDTIDVSHDGARIQVLVDHASRPEKLR